PRHRRVLRQAGRAAPGHRGVGAVPRPRPAGGGAVSLAGRRPRSIHPPGCPAQRLSSMRTVVARFLLLRFAGIFVFVLFTLTSLLVLFDLLAQADDLALHHEETLWPLAAYAGLRLPVLLTMIIPMSALLAALVTFERLASQYEL